MDAIPTEEATEGTDTIGNETFCRRTWEMNVILGLAVGVRVGCLRAGQSGWDGLGGRRYVRWGVGRGRESAVASSNQGRAGEAAQQGKVLAVKPSYLNSIPGPQTVGGEN